MFKTKDDITSWLDLMHIEEYVINEDLTVDVNKSVNLSQKTLIKLPVKFNIINGNFNCSSNSLHTLEGCPNIILGSFHCGFNLLTHLQQGPQIVLHDFYCNDNKLVSLLGAPEEIGYEFKCSNNALTSLQFGPKKVGCDYRISFHPETDKEELIGYDYRCELNPIINLNHFDCEIGRNFIHLSSTPIEDLEQYYDDKNRLCLSQKELNSVMLYYKFSNDLPNKQPETKKKKI